MDHEWRELLGESVLDRNNSPREADTVPRRRIFAPLFRGGGEENLRDNARAIVVPPISTAVEDFRGIRVSPVVAPATPAVPLCGRIQGVWRTNKIRGRPRIKSIRDPREVEKAIASR